MTFAQVRLARLGNVFLAKRKRGGGGVKGNLSPMAAIKLGILASILLWIIIFFVSRL